MKRINQLRAMSSRELAEFFHFQITSSTCPDCILNNLDVNCKPLGLDCIEKIKKYFESEE
jgi:hypothetical protein